MKFWGQSSNSEGLLLRQVLVAYAFGNLTTGCDVTQDSSSDETGHPIYAVVVNQIPHPQGRITGFVLWLPTTRHAYHEGYLLEDMVGAPPVLRLYPKRRRRPGGVDLHSAERSPGCQSCPQRDGSPLYHKLLSGCRKEQRRTGTGHANESEVFGPAKTVLEKPTGLCLTEFTLRRSSHQILGTLVCLEWWAM